MLRKRFYDPNSLCVKLSHELVLTGWWARPNCNLVLNCGGLPKCFLRQKLWDGKHIPSLGLAKTCTSFIGMDGILLEVHNRKEEYCAWSLAATTSRILALSLLLLSELLDISISLFVSHPCLTFLNSDCTSFISNQVYSLVRVYHRVIS
jgi:hypothetical protein